MPWPSEKQELGWGVGFFPPQTAPCPRAPILGAKGYRSDSSFLIQDQRLVGFPSLCVHVPVGSHADMVSGPAWLPGPWQWGNGGARIARFGIPKLPSLPLLSASGPTASCTRSSGTNSCPSPCTRVSVSGSCSAQDLPRERGREGTWGSSPILMPSTSAGFVQFLQYYYQSGCLYRLRALGERHTMDLTVGESGVAPPLDHDQEAGKRSPFLSPWV